MRPMPVVIPLLAAASLFHQALSAQDAVNPPASAEAIAAGREKLQKVLTKAGATTDTAFAAEWSGGTKQDGNNNGAVAIFLGNRGSAASGKVKGSWHQGLLRVTKDEGNQDELLLAGRRLIAKDKNTDWVLRSGRHADGTDIGYVPDIEALLQQLASWDLAVVQRTVGSLDDRPIEIFSVALNPDQVTAIAWADLVPDALVNSANPFAQIVRLQAAGGAARVAVPKPEAIVDLAIFVDPATGTLHRLQFRTWTKQDVRLAGGGAVIVRGGVAQQVGPAEEDEEEEEDAAKANAPLRYVDGLPERKRSKMTVRDFVIKLTGHGQTAAPQLTDAQRRLLGLPPR